MFREKFSQSTFFPLLSHHNNNNHQHRRKHLWPNVWGFSPPPSSRYQLSVLQLNSNTIYLEIVWDPTGWVFSPQDRSLLSPSNKSDLLNFWLTNFKLGFPLSLLWVWLICYRETYRTRRNPYIYWFTEKDILKNTDKQPEEEIHRARSGRVPSTGASVAVEMGHTTLPACGWVLFHCPVCCLHVLSDLEALQTLSLWVFMEALLYRHDWIWTV